jgi:hypothetical protein
MMHLKENQNETF